MQEDAVGHVVLPMRLLHAQEQLRRGEWNFDTFNGRQLDTSSRFFKVDTARRSHYIDQDVVRNADDRVVAEIVVAELQNGLLRQDLERLLHSSLISQINVDKDVDVFSCADEAMVTYGESADHYVAGSVCVEFSTERYEIAPRRRPPRTWNFVFHSLNSSQVLNR